MFLKDLPISSGPFHLIVLKNTDHISLGWGMGNRMIVLNFTVLRYEMI